MNKQLYKKTKHLKQQLEERQKASRTDLAFVANARRDFILQLADALIDIAEGRIKDSTEFDKFICSKKMKNS